MKLKVAEFFSVVLVMLVTGVFWGTWFTLTRSLDDFSAAEFIHIGKVIIANVAMPMRIIMPAALLFLLLTMIFSFRVNRISFWFYTGSFILMIVSLLITVGVEIPIDNQIKTWNETTVPANWQALRQTWKEFHVIRTFTSLTAFVLCSIGIINRIRLTLPNKLQNLEVSDTTEAS